MGEDKFDSIRAEKNCKALFITRKNNKDFPYLFSDAILAPNYFETE
jgi:hypothetical protein